MPLTPGLATFHRTQNRRYKTIVGSGLLLLLLAGLWNISSLSARRVDPGPIRSTSSGNRVHTFRDGTVYAKPAGTTIYGLVFYGRFDRVQILDCYLKKNLAHNGGFLDKVVFVSNTFVPSDRAGLDRLLRSEPKGYVLGRTVPAHDDTHDFHNLWEGLDPDVLYVKIDDDILYIHDDAIPSLVRYRLRNPEYFMVSANVINNPALSWVHERLGAVQPFVPEKTPPRTFSPSRALGDWRVSALPRVKADDAAVDREEPTRAHRWVRVEAGGTDGTAIAGAEYSAWGAGWKDWRLAAQQHYSFFENVERGEVGLENYWFRRWDMNYERLSINFVVVWGRDVVKSFPIPRDDEAYLTQDVPKRLGRHVVVHGDALAAHYAYKQQKDGIVNTDILERYRAFAKENCGKLLE